MLFPCQNITLSSLYLPVIDSFIRLPAIDSFIHQPLNNRFLNSYHMPDTVLPAGDEAAKETHCPSAQWVYVMAGKTF